MRRADAGAIAPAALVVAAAMAMALLGGCASSGYRGYGYDAYYGSPWGYDSWYDGDSIYVGPPDVSHPPGGRPPTARPPGDRPPHVSHQPVRPMPPPRPARRGGGRRR